MFRFLAKESNKQRIYKNVVDGLKVAYKTKLLPLEKHYNYHEFFSPALDDTDFDAKPMVMFVGQYSTGKTSFIRYLLEQDYPGIRVGPEPTTDRFVCIMDGNRECTIPGNALAVDSTKQFRALSNFGNSFLNRLECATLPSPILKNVTFIDTPGILSGEKQRVDRGYDFTGVLEWFAERVDRIILLFDAHKLDISDEFRRSIESLRGHDDKIRIVLNKADIVDQQQLLRVYGALMWSLGKIFKTPEVSRVYIGSFWDKPVQYEHNKKLFENEQNDLFKDLCSLPVNSALRKLNDLIKRARLAKVHALVIAELKAEMPRFFGQDHKKKELIRNLSVIFERIANREKYSMSDFPEKERIQEVLKTYDFNKLCSLNAHLINNVDSMLTDISKLSSEIPAEFINAEKNIHVSDQHMLFTENNTPFADNMYEGVYQGRQDQDWIVYQKKPQYQETFDRLPKFDNKVSGASAKGEMIKSKLPNAMLSKIWNLSDMDKDGFLDEDEFALAMYLIDLKVDGHDIPKKLPKHLIPPKHRATATVSTSGAAAAAAAASTTVDDDDEPKADANSSQSEK